MTANNDITGDRLVSKVPSKEFLDNYDQIFRKEQLSVDSGSDCGCGSDSKRNPPLVNEEVK